MHIYTLDTKQTNLPEGDLNSKKIFHKTTHIFLILIQSLCLPFKVVLIKASNLISVLCVLFIISLSLHLSKIKWRCLHSTILRFYKLCFQAHLVSASLVSKKGYYYFNVLELSIPGHRAHVSVLDIEHNRIERWGGVKLRSSWPWTVSSPLTESSVLFLTDNVPRFFIIQRLAIDQWPRSDSWPRAWHMAPVSVSWLCRWRTIVWRARPLTAVHAVTWNA